MWKFLLPIAALLAVLAGAVVSDGPGPKADVVFLNRGDVNTLDVQRMSWMQDFRVAIAIYEGLVRTDVFSHEFAKVPGVAERWEVSEDGRTWTFHLRSNAKWSNGAPLTAQDFVYSWRRAMLPDLVGDYAKLFTLIDGGKAFYDWRTEAIKAFTAEGQGRPRPAEAEALWKATLVKFDELVALKATDERTLVMRTVRRLPYWLDIVAFEAFFPVYGPEVDRWQSVDPVTGKLEFESGWTKPPNLVSNGKFKVTQWRFKRDMRLERNTHYWNQADIHVDSILLPSVGDPNAAVLSFQTGTVDWLSDVVPDYRSDLLRAKREYQAEHKALYDSLVAQGLDPVAIDRRMPPDPRQNIHSFPAFGTYFYNINCSPRLNDGRVNPFADPRVRRAFAMAVDRRNIAENVRRSGERPATELIPPGSMPGYTAPKGVGFDPEGAAKLLAEAGFAGGQGLPVIEVLFNRDGGHDVIAQAIKRDWEQYLGVSVRLDMKEIKVFRNDLQNHNFMVARAGWFGDYGDPTTFLEINRTGDGNNDRRYSSERFDGLLDRADAESDPAKRLEILAEAERVLVAEDLPLIPIFHYSLVMMFDPHRISGVSPHPRQKQNMSLLDVLDDGKGADRAKEMPPRAVGAASGAEGTGEKGALQ